MKVILFEAVENLGVPGDIVDVKDGYYRNYLGPRGLAEQATDSNLRRLAQKRKKFEEMARNELEAAQKRAEELKGLEVEFPMLADDTENLYGSVNVAEIDRALREKGVEIERRDILLGQPIKDIGEYEVPLRLHPDVTVDIAVKIVRAED